MTSDTTTTKVLHPVATGQRTPEDQLARLNRGGYTAKREREKLEKMIAARAEKRA